MPDVEEVSIKESVNHLRAAVSKINELSIAATPENYSIWYHYYSGHKPSLKTLVDQRLQNGGSYSAEFSRRVYAQFFLSAPEQELNQLRTAIKHLIDHLSKEVGAIGKNMSEYSETLESCGDQLEHSPEIEALQQIVKKLIEETQTCRMLNAESVNTVNQLNTEITQMREALQEMSEVAFEDALTGIPNRRAFDNKLEQLAKESKDQQTPICLLLLDVDLFKKVNDEHGHIVGDRVLRFVAEMIKRSVKGLDFVARFGGEEFAVLLPNTDIEGGYTVAASILKNVADTRVKINKEGKRLGSITLSGGVTQMKADDNIESLLERSDQLLYAAKHAGRNSIRGDLDEQS